MVSRYYHGAILLSATVAIDSTKLTVATQQQQQIEERQLGKSWSSSSSSWSDDGWNNDDWWGSSSSGKSGKSGSGSGKSGKSNGSSTDYDSNWGWSADDDWWGSSSSGKSGKSGSGSGKSGKSGGSSSDDDAWGWSNDDDWGSSSSGKSGKSGSGSGKSGKSGSSGDGSTWHGGWGSPGWWGSDSSSSSGKSGKSGSGSGKSGKSGSSSNDYWGKPCSSGSWSSSSSGKSGKSGRRLDGWSGWSSSSSDSWGSSSSGKSGKSGSGSGKSGKSGSSSSSSEPCHWIWVSHSSSGKSGKSGSGKSGKSGSKGSKSKSGKSSKGSSSSSSWSHDGWWGSSSSSSGKSGKSGSSSSSSSDDDDNWSSSGSDDDWSSSASGDGWSGSGSGSYDHDEEPEIIYSKGGSVAGWKSDGWEHDGHYKADMDYVRAKVVKLIEDSERELIPKFIRMGFHDCVGGCDGCINMDNPDNAGLMEAIEPLHPIYKEFEHSYSRADIWALATLVACDMSVLDDRPEGLKFPMRYIGRKDCEGSDDMGVGGPDPKLPGNDLPTHEFLAFMKDEFGYSTEETVIVMGMHAVAVAHRSNIGYGNIGKEDGWVFEADAYKLDNRYYKMLLDKEWEFELVHNEGKIPNRYQWYHEQEGKDERPIMTNTDMGLLLDLSGHLYTDEEGNEGAVSCVADGSHHEDKGGDYLRRRTEEDKKPKTSCPVSEETKEFIEEYALDNEGWLIDCEKVIEKMLVNKQNVKKVAY